MQDEAIDLLSVLLPLGVTLFAIAVSIGLAIYSRKRNGSSANKSATKKAPLMKGAQPINPFEPLQKSTHSATAHEKHIADAAKHSHKGVEEHYEEIVGSLGDVNDEGCADLDGVRFIQHDVAYEDVDEKKDYSSAVRAMVLGEVLNTPRFKTPYRPFGRRTK